MTLQITLHENMMSLCTTIACSSYKYMCMSSYVYASMISMDDRLIIIVFVCVTYLQTALRGLRGQVRGSFAGCRCRGIVGCRNPQHARTTASTDVPGIVHGGAEGRGRYEWCTIA